MLKMLVPVDGSEYGVRAVAYMAKLHDEDARIEVHLLNVQIPIESGHVRLFVEHDELQDYYREEGIAALAAARNALDQALYLIGFMSRSGTLLTQFFSMPVN